MSHSLFFPWQPGSKLCGTVPGSGAASSSDRRQARCFTARQPAPQARPGPRAQWSQGRCAIFCSSMGNGRETAQAYISTFFFLPFLFFWIIGIKEVIQKHFPPSITQKANKSCKNGDCNKTIILKYSKSCLYGKCDKIEHNLKIAAAIF